MKDIKCLHRQAMEQSDFALAARMRGDEQAVATHTVAAYEFEAQAANALTYQNDAEPTRSILFRSAATLARDCQRFVEAERLIFKGLSGEPPADIEVELRDLFEEVSFYRHLETRGVQLGDEEVQMVITGKSVGLGVAPADVFLGRVRSTEALLYRTAERQRSRPYRDRERRGGQVGQNLELYMSVPRAACFAVTLRVGGFHQPSLPGFSPGEGVIDELLDCLQLYTGGQEVELRKRIGGEEYYRNFVSLARTLQPDGAKIDMVGFTAVRGGTTKQVAMTKTISEGPSLTAKDVIPQGRRKRGPDGEIVELRGELLIANAVRRSGKAAGEIEIVTSDDVRIKVVVPPGMMSDIVKPLWESRVEVTGTRVGKKVHLLQIKLSPDMPSADQVKIPNRPITLTA